MSYENELITNNRILGPLYRMHRQFVDDHAFMKRVSKGESIWDIGARIPYVVFPIDSVIALRIFNPDDTISEPLVTGRNGTIGLAALLGDDKSLFSANAAVAGRAFFIGVNECIELFDHHEDVRRLFLSSVKSDMTIIATRSACLTRNSAPYRIACWLSTLSELSSQSILEITQRDIAESFSFRLATVSDACRILKNLGYIDYERGKIIVHNANIDRGLCGCRSAYNVSDDLNTSPAVKTA